ncbi:SWIM zinc finger family protein [Corallincola luteus]|uniref:SWIM zinc finger family protein n=1 Tax=Corallincola luteus TaxID=1775177 RepID=A0ABY2AGT4_9GAMM|nr:SWIM zinc finger family protein [Corallincola luteus]TCI01708.1 SWIM zinc finger family protein [Corallincola luteus]
MDREQVLALAPDTASVKAAAKLESLSKWQLLAQNERAIWGECKGSGKKPYLTRIDRDGHAFKCSCPSRKFPCKHGLALFLLFVDNSSAFTDGGLSPDWVQEWLDGRDKRADKAEAKASQQAKADPEAQKKRQLKRDDKILAGVTELSLWLQDLIRTGIAELPNKPYRYWDQLAARMVDAQAPGLATWLNRISHIVAGGDAMAETTAELAKLHLFLQACQKQESLSALSADIKSLLGISLPEAEVRHQPAVEDEWLVIAKRQSEENGLIQQSCWLYGLQRGEFAKSIQYAHDTQRAKLANDWFVGNVLNGAIHYYPSATPLRCCVGTYQTSQCAEDFKPSGDKGLSRYTELMSLNPWLGLRPVVLCNVIPVYQQERLYFVMDDDPGRALSASAKNIDIARLLVLSGGHSVTLFADWDGQQLYPLSIYAQGNVIALDITRDS